MSDNPLITHPTIPSFWRHDPPTWSECCVCGGPTCWVELDLAFTHPECEMAPSYRMVLGKEEVTADE